MKLTGSINGVGISFNFYPPNIFKGEIPMNLTGVYIVQLQATDDGGNTTEYSSTIIKIDFDSLKVTVLSTNYKDKLNNSKFEASSDNEYTSKYRTSEIDNYYNEMLNTNIYTYKELI